MYDRINTLITNLSAGLYEREAAVRLGLLSALAGESLFLLGRPGTGKSLVARRLQQAFRDAKAFSYLMGRFSTPEEVFGPISIAKLRDEDRYERKVTDYLPDADVVFLDEIWKASPPIQNALLTALNERKYRNGSQEITLPLKAFVGASNELPGDTEESAAFWDRFLVRLVLEPITDDSQFRALLRSSEDAYREVVPHDQRITAEEYDSIQDQAQQLMLPDSVLELISSVRASLAAGTDEAPPLYVSDRRWRKITGLLRTCAVLHGRSEVEPVDCAIIASCAWNTLEERARVTEVVTEELSRHAGNRSQSERAAAEIEELRSALEELQTARETVEERVARVYRDEYFRLIPRQGATDEQILVWHGDVEDLPEGERGAIDLFYYDSHEQLTGSERPEVTRCGEWELQVDEQIFTIETERREVTREQRREPSSSERAAIAEQVRALRERVDAEIELLVGRQQRLEDSSQAHLFVPNAAISVVSDALGATVGRMSELRVMIVELEQSITP
jgi:MoxR-like ATPase